MPRRAYPVYDGDLLPRDVLTVRRGWRMDRNVAPVGRNGMHRYNN